MSHEDWENFIEKQAENLTKEEKSVPGDDHYSNLMNKVITSGIAEFMRNANLIR